MTRDGTIKRYSANELRSLLEREGDRSDWARVASMTEEELEAAIASDPDDDASPIDWSRVTVTAPRKEGVFIRLDPDVLAHFRAGGPGYQTRINAVLRSYVEHVTKKARKA